MRHMSARTLVLSSALALVLSSGFFMPRVAHAEDIDFGKLFSERALKCLHPTVNPATAKVEIEKPAAKDGDVSTARLKVFYHGFLKTHSMDVDVLVRQSGSIRQLKVNVLADTGMELTPCHLTKEWGDF